MNGTEEKRVKRSSALLTAAVTAAVALRVLYLAQPWRIDWRALPMFLGDEGAHGLMAMHILEGARPVFFYGGYYQGALEPYLVACMFRLLGVSLAVLRLLPVLGALVSIPLTYLVGRKVYGKRAGLLAAVLVALPSAFMFHWGSIAVCPYATYAPLVLGILYAALVSLERPGAVQLATFGFLGGVAVWSLPLAATYFMVCAAAVLLWARPTRTQLLAGALALALGVSPLVYGNVVHPLATVAKLGRKMRHSRLLAETAGREGERHYRANPFLQTLGFQTGRDGTPSPLGMLGAAVLVIGMGGGCVQTLVRWRGRHEKAREGLVLLGCLVAGVATGAPGFSGQPIGRYLLAFYPLAALVAVGWWSAATPRGAMALVAAAAAANAVEIARPVPWDGGADRAEVIRILEDHGLRFGYAAGQMYELVFRSKERIRIVPLDHARIPRYRRDVARADRVFYVFRVDQERKAGHRAFARHIEGGRVRHKEIVLADHRIWFDFDPPEAVSTPVMDRLIREYKNRKWHRD